MSDNHVTDENLSEAFRNLGKNIVDVFRAAWERPERKNLQQEIENGLNAFGSSMKKEIDNFSDSAAGQQIKSDVESLKEQLRSGETEAKVRNEVLKSLRIVNIELERISKEFSGKQTSTETESVPPAEGPVDQASS
jgi:hypothetical protein